jgi:glycosyltransferase involved in cell wall biosynthesis
LAKLPISVLIDTYNQERFIEKAITSVLERDFPVAEREIIVVDDGSTDRTPQIVQRFEPNLRYIRKENGGQASAFNVGIPECQGQIIAFLDGDDYWLPGRLSRVADVLATNSAVGCFKLNPRVLRFMAFYFLRINISSLFHDTHAGALIIC